MQVYDFEKHRKIINAELKDRYIKRKENLKKVKETYRNDNYPNENKYCGVHKEVLDLDEIKSKFAYIENKTIGSKNLNSKHIYKSISNKNIDYNKFVNCHFNNIKFENCTFIGNTFNNCVFNNISFSHCNFYDEEENIMTLFENNCRLENCNFYKSNMKNTIFNLVKFSETRITLRDSSAIYKMM